MFAWGTSCNMVCICISMHTDTVCSLLTSIVQMFRYCLVYFPSHRVYFDIMCTDAYFIHYYMLRIVTGMNIYIYLYIYATVCTCWWFVFPWTWSLSCFLLVTWCVNIGKKDAPPWMRHAKNGHFFQHCQGWSGLGHCHDAQRWCLKNNCNWHDICKV